MENNTLLGHFFYGMLSNYQKYWRKNEASKKIKDQQPCGKNSKSISNSQINVQVAPSISGSPTSRHVVACRYENSSYAEFDRKKCRHLSFTDTGTLRKKLEVQEEHDADHILKVSRGILDYFRAPKTTTTEDDSDQIMYDANQKSAELPKTYDCCLRDRKNRKKLKHISKRYKESTDSTTYDESTLAYTTDESQRARDQLAKNMFYADRPTDASIHYNALVDSHDKERFVNFESRAVAQPATQTTTGTSEIEDLCNCARADFMYNQNFCFNDQYSSDISIYSSCSDLSDDQNQFVRKKFGAKSRMTAYQSKATTDESSGFSENQNFSKSVQEVEELSSNAIISQTKAPEEQLPRSAPNKPLEELKCTDSAASYFTPNQDENSSAINQNFCTLGRGVCALGENSCSLASARSSICTLEEMAACTGCSYNQPTAATDEVEKAK